MNSGMKFNPLEFGYLGGWVPIYMNVKYAGLYVNVKLGFYLLNMFHWNFKSLLGVQSGT